MASTHLPAHVSPLAACLAAWLALVALSAEAVASRCDHSTEPFSFEVAKAIEDAERVYACDGPQLMAVIVGGEQEEYPDVYDGDLREQCWFPHADFILVVYRHDIEAVTRKLGTLDNLVAYAKAYNRRIREMRESRQGTGCRSQLP